MIHKLHSWLSGGFSGWRLAGVELIAFALLVLLTAIPAGAAEHGKRKPSVDELNEFNPKAVEDFVAKQAGTLEAKDTAASKFAVVAAYALQVRMAGQEGAAGLRKELGDKFIDGLKPLAFEGKSEALWRLFFDHAVILVGNGLSTQPIVAFYNPLVDGVALLGLKTQADGNNIPEHFTLLSGQTLRKLAKQEKLASSEFPVALMAYYQQTSQAFAKLYPPESRNSQPWAFDQAPLEDAAKILARADALEQATKQMMQHEYYADKIGAFQHAASAGDVEGLRALFPPGTAVPPEWIAAIPQQLRRGFEPVAAYKQGKGVEVVMATAGASRLLTVLRMPSDGQKDSPPFSDIVISDYAKLSRSY
ncbi:MAG: hypothetical protein WDO70_03505 [Alphaproteobacteria bacterium]